MLFIVRLSTSIIVEAVQYVSRVTLPVLMINGRYDFFFPEVLSQQPLFDLLGTAPADKDWIHLEASHGFPLTDIARHVYPWLDQHLGPVRLGIR